MDELEMYRDQQIEVMKERDLATNDEPCDE